MARQVVADAIHEWWVTPQAVALPPDRTLFGAVSSTGEIVACEMDHTTGRSDRVVVSQVEPDDHNAPAMWAAPGRRAIMAWTRHGVDLYVRVRVSNAAAELASFRESPEHLIWTPGASYSQIHHLPHLSTPTQDVFWLFMRIGILHWGFVQVTIDQATGALTHTPVQTLLTSAGQCYIATASDHDPDSPVIRFAWGYNPAQPTSAVRYVEIDTISGAITSPVDPTVSANMSGTGLPLIDEDVAPLLPEPDPAHSRRLFYVRPGPASPAVAYADWMRDDPDSAVYKVTAWTGAEWATTEYGVTGPRVGSTANANYVSGMVFPDPCVDDTVAIARRSEGVSSVELVTPTGTQALASDTAFLIRPMFPTGRTDRVLASRVTRYSSFRDYYADVVALFDDPDSPVNVTEVDRVAILCGELRTGRVLAEISVSDASWEQVHRDAGKVDITVPDAVLRERPELLSYLEGPRCFLAAQRGTTLLEAGPIWAWDYQPGGMRVGAAGLLSYYDHRKVMRVYDGTRVQDQTIRWTGVDLSTIAVRLVKLAHAHTGGSVPVVLPPERTGTHERTWHGYELADLGTELRRLMEVQNGPDLALTPRLTRDGLRVEWVLRAGSALEPMLSQDGPDWVWDTSVVRGSVAGLSVKRDWSGMATRWWATGAGFDSARLMFMVDDPAGDLYAAGYPLLEGQSDHSSVERMETLRGHSLGALSRSRRPWQTWTLTVKSDPNVAHYRPGDWGRVWVPPEHPVLGALARHAPSHRVRVLRLSGGLTDDVTVTMAPEMEAR